MRKSQVNTRQYFEQQLINRLGKGNLANTNNSMSKARQRKYEKAHKKSYKKLKAQAGRVANRALTRYQRMWGVGYQSMSAQKVQTLRNPRAAMFGPTPVDWRRK